MSDDRQHIYAGAPRGAEDARVDDKGRLKLPAKYVEYLQKRQETVVFITTLDPATKMSLIYPSSEWEYRQGRWAEAARRGAEFEAAVAKVQMVADHYGKDSEIDGQGRVLVPAALRKQLGLENSKVWLRFEHGKFSITPDAEYQATLNRAEAGAAEATGLLKSVGEL
jgi:MraZ protein